MVEYALLLSLVALALVGTIGGMAGQIGSRFNAISNTLASGGNGGSGGGGTTPGGGGTGSGTTPPPSSPQTPPANTGDSKWNGDHDDLSLPAYAVYCSEDASLEFFRDKGDMPNVGERSRTGKLVNAVFTDFENNVSMKKTPWLDESVPGSNPTKIYRIRFVDRIRPRSMYMWFSYATAVSNSEVYMRYLRTADLTKLDVSNVSDMSYLFKGADNLTTIVGTDGWDTSRLINLSNAFYGCSSLTEIPGIEGWDVKNVYNVTSMFENCTKLKADLSSWSMSKLPTINQRYFNDGAPLVVRPSSWGQ